MVYAVNLFDWVAHKDDICLAILLQPVVNTNAPIDINKRRVDETAVSLDCGEDRAAAIIEVIRKKFKPYQFRCYQSKTGNGGWKRITASG